MQDFSQKKEHSKPSNKVEAQRVRLANQVQKLEQFIEEYSINEDPIRSIGAFFRRNRNFGSRDRRFYRDKFFNYLRVLPRLSTGLSFHAKLLLSELFLEDIIDPMFIDVLDLNTEHQQLACLTEKTLDERRAILSMHEDLMHSEWFPLQEELSPMLDIATFLSMQTERPLVHIRLRHSVENALKELSDLGFEPIALSKNAYSILNKANLHETKAYKSGSFEIQDLNAQKVCHSLDLKQVQSAWDSCAGSGGKGIHLLDIKPEIKLAHSDLRQSILKNLTERYQRNGLEATDVQLLDLENTQELKAKMNGNFDLILVDAPCSGSGTWIRHPEWFSRAFSLKDLQAFAERQKRIVQNCVPYLKIGGVLLYCTCSVYAIENEQLAEEIADSIDLELERMEYLTDFTLPSSSLFIALFRST